MTEPQDTNSITHLCPSCHQPVSCGNELGCDSCWCLDLPKIPYEYQTGDRCLCAACLQAKIDRLSQQREL